MRYSPQAPLSRLLASNRGGLLEGRQLAPVLSADNILLSLQVWIGERPGVRTDLICSTGRRFIVYLSDVGVWTLVCGCLKSSPGG